jgi:hypothetical protein
LGEVDVQAVEVPGGERLERDIAQRLHDMGLGLLGGGQRDANWDRSGMTHHRLAILPGVTHYDINGVPALSAAVIPFLDGAT